MTAHEDNVELLPPDDGASPWLPTSPVTVPVFADGDYDRKIGTASVYADEDRSLRADVTFHDDFPADGFSLRFSVSGRILTEEYVNDVRVAQTIQILSVGAHAVAAAQS